MKFGDFSLPSGFQFAFRADWKSGQQEFRWMGSQRVF
uniref:Uncharacterized protein n=1 Tax=Rhizophora mucronata TaxID=61149 RepID=A0A2P2N6E0_RHIMU